MGEPDYEYMEQYAKNIMLKKYKQYLDYLENKGKLYTNLNPILGKEN